MAEFALAWLWFAVCFGICLVVYRIFTGER